MTVGTILQKIFGNIYAGYFWLPRTFGQTQRVLHFENMNGKFY